jgi:hypothetical protein
MDTVKVLKSENKKLLVLLKESEKTLTDKLKESRREMEKMTTIINQLWPFIQSHLKKEIGSTKIAELKKMAKEESRIDFLDTLSKIIGRVKKDAEKQGRSLFGTETDTRYEQLRKDYLKLENSERELKSQMYDKDSKEAIAKEMFDKLKCRLKEFDAFRLTATDFIMTKATSQEEILFLVRANERINAFQEKDLLETDEKFEDGGFITNRRHYEILDDYEPAPSFLKALTNEILYLDQPESDELLHDSYGDKLFSDTYIQANDFIENLEGSANPYLHIQKINMMDNVPGLITDSLDTRHKTRLESYDDLSNPRLGSSGKDSLTSLKQQRSARDKTLNTTGEYAKSDPMGLTGYTYDKLGSTIDQGERKQ